MKKKNAIIIAIILMSIGFITILTILIINRNTRANKNQDDFSVIFTAASLDGKDVYSTVVDDTKKIINFSTSSLKQESILTYVITNNSSHYDANVSVTCVPKPGTASKYIIIKNKLENDATEVKAKSSLIGTLTVTFDELSTKDVAEYTCKLEVNAVERDKVAVSEPTLFDLIKNKADTTTAIDYKMSSKTSETNGIFTTTQTEKNVPVYYFRGAADKVNNNIIFNNMCWKIIRTTETGGVKIIYNGTPIDGKCEIQAGTLTQIGTSAFNEIWNDNAYVGYMYGTAGSTTYEATHNNINDSTIKTYIDSWYNKNFDAITTAKLEDTVFCNDRSTKAYDENTIGLSMSSYGNLGYGKNETLYGAAHRASIFSTNPNPSLVCQNENDKFTVNSKNGNGALTYPVGLITLDEVILAGFNTKYSNISDYFNRTDYLYTGSNYWTLSPVYKEMYASVGSVCNIGCVDQRDVKNALGIRPVVSLNNNTHITGEGTKTNPYVVK